MADGTVTQSMDEILAQIRKIIAEEPGTISRPTRSPPPPVTAMTVAAMPTAAVPAASPATAHLPVDTGRPPSASLTGSLALPASVPEATAVMPVSSPTADDLSDLIEVNAPDLSPPASAVAADASIADPVADLVEPAQVELVATVLAAPMAAATMADGAAVPVEPAVPVAPPTSSAADSAADSLADLLADSATPPDAQPPSQHAAMLTDRLPLPRNNAPDAVDSTPDVRTGAPITLPLDPSVSMAVTPEPLPLPVALPEAVASTWPASPAPSVSTPSGLNPSPAPASPPATMVAAPGGAVVAPPVSLSSMFSNRIGSAVPSGGILLPTHIGRAVERAPMPAPVASAEGAATAVPLPAITSSSALGALAAGLAAVAPETLTPAQAVTVIEPITEPVVEPTVTASVAASAPPTPVPSPSVDAVMAVLEPLLADWVRTDMPHAMSEALRVALPDLIARATTEATRRLSVSETEAPQS